VYDAGGWKTGIVQSKIMQCKHRLSKDLLSKGST
jgi:hypothetical protein